MILRIAATILLLAAPISRATAQELPTADSLIEQYVEAIGGRDAYLSATSMRTTGAIEIAAMGLSGTFEIVQRAPDRMLLHASLPQVGELENGFDGEVGWNIDPLSGPRVLAGEELTARRERASFLGVIRDPTLVPERETVELAEYDGRECWRVRLVWTSGRETHDCYSTETGLLVASEDEQMSQMGRMEVTITYRDYEEFEDGIRLPMEVTQSAMGQVQRMSVETVEFAEVGPEAFEPPPAIRTLLEDGGVP